MKRILSFVFLFAFVNGINAQKDLLESIESGEVIKIGSLQLNDSLNGYYVCIQLEGNSDKENLSRILIFDQNLTQIQKIEFTQDIEWRPVEVEFNGKAFCVLSAFSYGKYSYNDFKSFLYFFDLSGKFTKKVNLEENFSISTSRKSNLNFITPVSNEGFVLDWMVPNSKGNPNNVYSFDNFGSELNRVQGTLVRLVAQSYFVSNPVTEKTKSSLNISAYNFKEKAAFLQFKQIDDNNLIEILEILKVPNKEKQFYFVITKKPLIEKKKWATIDETKSGQIQFFKIIDNNKADTIKILPMSLKRSDSKTQLEVLKSDAFYNELSIYSVFLFGKNYYLAGLNEIDDTKDKYEYINIQLDSNFTIKKNLKHELISLDGFQRGGGSNGYIYTDDLAFERGTTSNENYYASLYYIKNKGKKKMVNSVLSDTYFDITLEIYGASDTFEPIYGKLDFDFKSDYYQILPAKPGYVCIFEYFEKEKKIDFRLEKFDF